MEYFCAGFAGTQTTGIWLVRIAAISDLHIWGPISKKLITEFDELHERADVLVIAGDITNNGLLVQAERAATLLERARIPIVAVLGAAARPPGSMRRSPGSRRTSRSSLPTSHRP
jgi:3',5'-cyclic AMP phosphodiesterase CpdA